MSSIPSESADEGEKETAECDSQFEYVYLFTPTLVEEMCLDLWKRKESKKGKKMIT